MCVCIGKEGLSENAKSLEHALKQGLAVGKGNIKSCAALQTPETALNITVTLFTARFSMAPDSNVAVRQSAQAKLRNPNEL